MLFFKETVAWTSAGMALETLSTVSLKNSKDLQMIYANFDNKSNISNSLELIRKGA